MSKTNVNAIAILLFQLFMISFWNIFKLYIRPAKSLRNPPPTRVIMRYLFTLCDPFIWYSPQSAHQGRIRRARCYTTTFRRERAAHSNQAFASQTILLVSVASIQTPSPSLENWIQRQCVVPPRRQDYRSIDTLPDTSNVFNSILSTIAFVELT